MTGETRRVVQWTLAIALPLLALIGEFALRSMFQPSIWFLFYPAVFLSSWLGGLRAALISSALSVACALWFLVPPTHSFAAPLGHYFAVTVFLATGVSFGLVHDRLRRANQRTALALAASERANADLSRAVNERWLFAALFENSPDFVGIADPDGKPMYLNPAGRRMIGWPDDRSIGDTNILEFYPEEQRAFVSEVIVGAVMKVGYWQGEMYFRHWQTHGLIPVSHTYFAVRAPDSGVIVGIATITRDISDIKRARDEAESARRQLQQTKEELASFVEQAPDGIFVADLEGRYTAVNAAGCRMLGVGRDAIIGKSIVDFIPADKAEGLAHEKQIMLHGGAVVSEWALRRADGTYLPVEVSARILRDGRWQAFVRDISRRKQLEVALHASHADLDRAQSIAKVGSWSIDPASKELRWSAENYRILGLPSGTPTTYEAFLTCVHPDDRTHVEQQWKAALRGEPYDVEHRIICGDELKWVRERVDLEFDEHHALIRGIGITHDITEQKRHEQALRDAQERLELALAGADLATWDWNIKTGEVIFNRRWAEMRDFDQDEIAESFEYWAANVHHDDLPRALAVLAEHFRGERAGYDDEHRVRKKSGECIWVLDRGKVFARNARGEPIRMVGTELDITVRKRAEEKLRRAEANAQFLSEVGSVLASTLDVQGTLNSIGALATRSLADFCLIHLVEDGKIQRVQGFARDPARMPLIDRIIASPHHQIDISRRRARASWAELQANRSVLRERVSPETAAEFAESEDHLEAIRALDPRSGVASPLFAHGKLLGALILVSSTPGRAYTESDVRLVEQLAQRAAYAVDNAQLYADARDAIETRNNVLGVVAHDLRNPLGTILMQAAMLREPARREPDRRSRKPADSIERSAKRMNRLIQDLLDVARLDEDRLSVEPARLATHKAVCDSVEAQTPLADASSLTLHYDLAHDLPEVFADRDRLIQIFENLIGNAIKFSKPGGTITVGAAPKGDQVLFWVADTGIGIAAEDLPHAFDRFWQARKGDYRGAGLGLPIVKGLVEAHGGRVWVESTQGRGSIFFFTLPAAGPPMAQGVGATTT